MPGTGNSSGAKVLLRPFRLLDRYVMRALAGPVVAIAGALGLVMLLERALRLLQEMAALGIHGKYFLPLMLRLIPYYLMQAIPAAFVAALILVIGRMASDREWEAMAAAGASPGRIVRPMVLVAALLGLATLLVSGWLEPVGRYGYRTLHALAVNESRIRALQPRAVYVPSAGAMLSADAIGPDGLRRVFLWLGSDDGTELVATAAAGRVVARREPSSLDVLLDRGRVLLPGERLVTFGSFSANHELGFGDARRKRGRDVRELTLSELLPAPDGSEDDAQRDQRLAEIFGRVARSMAILVMPWIALPLLLPSRAQRRWPAIALIVAMVVIFYHGVNFGRNLAANGQLDVAVAALLAVVVPVAAAALTWRLAGGQQAHSPLQWLADLWPARLPRAPRLTPSPGRRRLLGGYLDRQLWIMIGGVLAGLVLLLQVVDLLERGETLVRSGTGAAGFLTYAWYTLPATLVQAAPIAVLGGALLAFARLRASNELVAVSTLGISALGIFRRTLLVPLLLGVALFGVAELWAPRAQTSLSAWWAGLTVQEARDSPAKRRWFRLNEGLASAAGASADGRTLADLHLYRRDADGGLVERVVARDARWTGGGWQLRDVASWRLDRPRQVARAATADWSPALAPAQVRRFFAAPVPLSSRDAWLAMQARAPADQARSLYLTRIMASASLVMVPVVMLMLATALIVRPGREVRLAKCLFQAGAAGLGFLVANGYLQVLGQSGELPPLAAVLVAPLLFGGAALELLLRSERER